MDWTIAATILASLGGREFIVWLANRKTHARKEKANAKEAELTVYEKQIALYEKRLEQRDAKVDTLYRELREEQKLNADLTQENNKLKLDIEVSTLHKCEVRGCPERQPPGLY